ncbi:PREDICTED: putative defensin-like protein 233 [Camelina sativa]|uniref:Defensin-like protein 233 n=1 Tax=Camelina sativa TaxID=90675 RepID=A0ABM1QN45_CAMSA|nr:PREDICTED: putative defensin-like protein 233 [Camelina sativa]
MRSSTLFISSCIFICLILIHIEGRVVCFYTKLIYCITLFYKLKNCYNWLIKNLEVEAARAPPQDCWDLITFPGKCGSHGKKKCFKEMEAKMKQRFLQCTCKNLEDEPKPPTDEHDCICQRENPYDCNVRP